MPLGYSRLQQIFTRVSFGCWTTLGGRTQKKIFKGRDSAIALLLEQMGQMKLELKKKP